MIICLSSQITERQVEQCSGRRIKAEMNWMQSRSKHSGPEWCGSLHPRRRCHCGWRGCSWSFCCYGWQHCWSQRKSKEENDNWQVEADAVQDHHHKDTGHRHTVRTSSLYSLTVEFCFCAIVFHKFSFTFQENGHAHSGQPHHHNFHLGTDNK